MKNKYLVEFKITNIKTKKEMLFEKFETTTWYEILGSIHFMLEELFKKEK